MSRATASVSQSELCETTFLDLVTVGAFLVVTPRGFFFLVAFMCVSLSESLDSDVGSHACRFCTRPLRDVRWTGAGVPSCCARRSASSLICESTSSCAIGESTRARGFVVSGATCCSAVADLTPVRADDGDDNHSDCDGDAVGDGHNVDDVAGDTHATGATSASSKRWNDNGSEKSADASSPKGVLRGHSDNARNRRDGDGSGEGEASVALSSMVLLQSISRTRLRTTPQIR